MCVLFLSIVRRLMYYLYSHLLLLFIVSFVLLLLLLIIITYYIQFAFALRLFYSCELFCVFFFFLVFNAEATEQCDRDARALYTKEYQNKENIYRVERANDDAGQYEYECIADFIYICCSMRELRIIRSSSMCAKAKIV